MADTGLEKDLFLCITAVQRAARICEVIYEQDIKKETSLKSDNSPVTCILAKGIILDIN